MGSWGRALGPRGQGLGGVECKVTGTGLATLPGSSGGRERGALRDRAAGWGGWDWRGSWASLYFLSAGAPLAAPSNCQSSPPPPFPCRDRPMIAPCGGRSRAGDLASLC